ncbi:hypothetical protein ASPACDRAFT_41097 [Aspergillus aculeatus ATCC 16872]|uniref:C2H2-type domain-containing protein n=1 Tax=Aspergillus aculeatus (strain ATCC 16872 / CBS 172.66 / WB 5094) TaxID=690307 RepID=A0A1L9X1G4_ASPA1|nr:uncharacterized protein ASPACDRAFT_41097 [Aspergillus aculeatus ATCC 16872]OJK02273.1 hypothetical protein ASPACDRAFT_41097 [Aspergillus aculeatus ATCC 16872]
MLSKGIHHSPGYPQFYHRQLSGSCARSWNLPSSSSPSSLSDLAKLDDFRRPRSVAPQSSAAPTPAISAWSAGVPHPGSASNAPGSLRSSISTNEGQHHLPLLHTISGIARTPFPSELVPPDSEPRGLPASGLLRSRNPEQASFDTPRTSIPYSYPSSSVSGSPSSIPDPAFAPAPSSYLTNQPDYYMAPSSSLSQTPNSIPHPQGLMPTGTVYSSPESAQNSSDPEQQQVRVISFRPKPQCWDHGCNGREFSTFSNLLRHQREKSGVVAKAECPSCGAVFTRTTARNIHVAQGKCKGIAREPSAE